MTDRIEEMFADLRVGAVPAVRPPGTDAARRTVSRRRSRRSAATGAAVLALIGGVTWSARPGDTPPAPAVAVSPIAGRPDAAATPSDVTRANAQRALQRITALGARFSPRPATSEVDRSVWAGRFRVPHPSTLRVVCFGPGSVRAVAVSVGTQGNPDSPAVGPVLAERLLRCTAQGASVEVKLQIPRGSGVAVRLESDAAARNRAGYAVAVDIV